MNQLLRDKKENLVYLAMWLILLAAPALSMYVRSTHIPEMPFSWSEIAHIWQMFLVFFIIFAIHNFLIAPLLIYKHRKAHYFIAIACLLAAFVVVQCSTKPYHRRMNGDNPELFERHHDKHRWATERAVGNKEGLAIDSTGARPHRYHHFPRKGGLMGPIALGPAEVINTIFLILIFGMNLGIKLYFKNERDRKKMHELKDQNLEHQLAYLKYQINPHFFMNTLNNIHALVDIDPEKAKKSIVVLSKMMRHILYEGNNEAIPLQNEIAFINNYVTLMRMRYTDKVSINLDMPQFNIEGEIPPLLLITFVENAFKHGISYEHESFIDLHISTTDEQIIFRCQNSKAKKPNQEKGGVGLSNVQQRLDLLYKDRYQLEYRDEASAFEVELRIPLKIEH